MSIKAAKLEKSTRLKRVLKVLSDGREHSTLDIFTGANCCAVNTASSELRAQGAEIVCACRHVDGERRFYYRMTKAPADA